MPKPKPPTAKAVAQMSGPPAPHAITFEVAGRMMPKERARAGGGHHYTPKDTRRAEEAIREITRVAFHGYGPWRGAVRVDLDLILSPPESWSARRRARALEGEVVPTSKPDVDNWQKALFDGAEGVAYRNDSQITEVVIRKRYGPRSKAVVTMTPLPGEPAYAR
ncbi:hypothetical protein CKO28_09050 [Rhodovibrio sodomensis]|uniref:Uncharacterized protein n=2 Tax=Rhodovibrio sodomensis TaxID=1088 RepID=A0ABS1DEJ9_9PROT|nr:hypothetical protein [Rhodovibrio sodomensis]